MKVALSLPREALHHNINHRVDLMLRQGLEEEVQRLLPHQHLNALQTVGYRELFAYLGGQSTRAAAVEAVKQNTRQYAKRQLTWFRKDPDYRWFAPAQLPEIISHVDAALR